MNSRWPWSSWKFLLLQGILTVRVSAQDSSCKMPLCYFDAQRTGQCQVSKEYATALVGLQGGVWSEILTSKLSCETNQSSCASTAKCQLDGRGLCTLRPSWLASKLFLPAQQGGAGFGNRCGFFGQLLAARAGCSSSSDQASCQAALTSSSLKCAWNATGNLCDVDTSSVAPSLTEDAGSLLPRVDLQRRQCSLSHGADCNGPSLRTLLAIAGEDCPLSWILSGHDDCSQAVDALTCNKSVVRSDGLPGCVWRRTSGGGCEGNPVALEFDLVALLGLERAGLQAALRAAYQQCSSLSQALCSTSFCAPPVVDLSATAAGHRSDVSKLAFTVMAAWFSLSAGI